MLSHHCRSPLRLVNGDGEHGRALVMWITARVVVDVYLWPALRCKCWRMPDVGVWLDVRIGRLEV